MPTESPLEKRRDSDTWGLVGGGVKKYEDPVETPTNGYMRLGIRSHAKGTFHSFIEEGKELEAAKMFRVAANNFIVNETISYKVVGDLVFHKRLSEMDTEDVSPYFVSKKFRSTGAELFLFFCGTLLTHI